MVTIVTESGDFDPWAVARRRYITFSAGHELAHSLQRVPLSVLEKQGVGYPDA